MWCDTIFSLNDCQRRIRINYLHTLVLGALAFVGIAPHDYSTVGS
jgi:hypothetical protein